MSSYQGPNVSVRQQFVVSPGAVAIESLPPTAAATAYDVFRKESVGDAWGLIDRILAWGTSNKVVYEESIAGRRAYNFYPPYAYANSKFGNIDLMLGHSDFSEDGIAVGRNSMYEIPNTAKLAGTCQAILPYYQGTTSPGGVQIPSTSLNTVIISGGTVVTSQIKPGCRVFISNTGGYDYIDVGIVGSIGTDETKIFLATPYSAAITDGDHIIIGSANSTDLVNYPEIFFDPTADFISNKVAVGDVVEFDSLSFPTSLTTPFQASVIAIINKNTLRVNTEALGAGVIDSDLSKYFNLTANVGSTLQAYSYSVKRLVGFSQNYLLKIINTYAGVPVTYISDYSLSFPGIVGGDTVPSLKKGDIFIMLEVNPDIGNAERDTTYPKPVLVDTITFSSGNYTITTIEPIYKSAISADEVYENGNFIQAWNPKIKTDIVTDFRAIRAEEHNVVKKITSMKDIFTAWVRSEDETIDPRNELAFMVATMFARSGGKVCYGINVDSSAANLSGEYTDALEELKLFDVYSHCFGTTDSGVNGIVGAYCDDQADPYEGHERIGIICYDLDDIYLMGSDTGSIDEVSGIITLNGSFDPIAGGVTVNDIVSMFDSEGTLLASATVVSTPTIPTEVHTDYSGDAISTPTFRFESGRKEDQAVKGGSIKYGNRRVSMIWPGWFYADYNGERGQFPPYFIAACICGMDSGIIASQSFTNMPFSVPGLSNLQMDTNTYFRKRQLDDIGGGGVDIIIQDATITQSIKSRHDLTTNMDAVQYRERSITKQADVCAKTIRAATAPYVGRYNVNDPNLFKFLGQVCSVVCTKLVKDGIIARITTDKIARDEEIDDKINFFVTATAYIAGNYYDITLLVKTR